MPEQGEFCGGAPLQFARIVPKEALDDQITALIGTCERRFGIQLDTICFFDPIPPNCTAPEAQLAGDIAVMSARSNRLLSETSSIANSLHLSTRDRKRYLGVFLETLSTMPFPSPP